MEEGKFYLLVDNRDDVITWNEGTEPAPPTPETPEIPGEGEQTGTVYLKVNSQWPQYNACFAAYFIGADLPDTWVGMEACESGVYKCAAPAGYDKVIFVRFNPQVTKFDWDENKWGQTEDLSVPVDEKVCYVLNEGFWNKTDSPGQNSGSWQEYTPGTEPEEPGPEEPGQEEPEECEWYLIGEHQNWAFGAENVTPLYKVKDNLYVAKEVNLKETGFKLTQKNNTSWDNVFGSHSGDYKYTVGTDGWYVGLYTNNRDDKSNDIKLSDWSGPFDVYIRYVQVADWGKELGFAIVKAGDPYPAY